MVAREARSTVDREIVTMRLFDAPRALVFEVWSDPERLRRWWGPKGFTNTSHEFDFRSGEAWRFVCLDGPPRGACVKRVREMVAQTIEPGFPVAHLIEETLQ